MNSASQRDCALAAMRDRIANSDLLPKSYAHYRRVVADALQFFLQHLSAVRLNALFGEQLALAASASMAQRVAGLFTHSPVLHKLGQVVARDRRLSKAFRRHLQQLESVPPKTSMDWLSGRIFAECKDLTSAGVELGTEPLAEGSVAVVVPFTWSEANSRHHRGVFKLLKPGVESQLEEDVEALSRVGSFLSEQCDHYALPRLDFQETFRTIKELLVHEVQFEREQHNLREAARIYAQSHAVVPALLPFCSPRLTAMERLEGHPIPMDCASGTTRNGDSLAQTIVEALVARAIFSTDEAALFHADPHGGNLFVLPEHRVGILDWSMVGHLPSSLRILLIQLLLAATVLDVERMKTLIRQISHGIVDENACDRVLEGFLRNLRWGALPGLSWLVRLLDELTLRAGVKFCSNLLLFRKSLLTLDGVLGDLLGHEDEPSDCVLDAVVAAMLLKNFALEWPHYLLAPPDKKSPKTHLSKTDILTHTWASLSLIPRWWNQTAADFFQCR